MKFLKRELKKNLNLSYILILGALVEVDEVYGCHNWPFGKPGEMYVQPGYMMSCATSINVVVNNFSC